MQSAPAPATRLKKGDVIDFTGKYVGGGDKLTTFWTATVTYVDERKAHLDNGVVVGVNIKEGKVKHWGQCQEWYGVNTVFAPVVEPASAPVVEEVVEEINRKKKYYTIDATTANIKTEIKTEFVEERQTIEEAYKVLAAAVEGFKEKGYKFPSFDFEQVKETHKSGFAFNIQSDWRERDETFVMLGTFCVYPGVE